MKKMFSGAFSVFTIFAGLAYFLSCLTPYISSVSFWPMSILALGFPYLALFILILVFPWFFIKRKAALCLLLLLLAGYQNLHATFAINLSAKKIFSKDTSSLRILAWNVRSFDNPSVFADSPMSVRRRMFNYIKKSGADILCFQEYAEHIGPNLLSNTEELVKQGYKYFYKTNELPVVYSFGTIINGTVIFSKLPIIDSGKVLITDSAHPEHLAYVSILFKNRPIRIFATHFRSLALFSEGPETSKLFYDSVKLNKLKQYDQEHCRQAFLVKSKLNQSPYPVIFSGDINSVPTSYSYNIMSKDMQDAFLKRGWGLGGTMDYLPKTLRIDLVLADKQFEIKKFKKDELHLSDHFPQITDVAWKK